MNDRDVQCRFGICVIAMSVFISFCVVVGAAEDPFEDLDHPKLKTPDPFADLDKKDGANPFEDLDKKESKPTQTKPATEKEKKSWAWKLLHENFAFKKELFSQFTYSNDMDEDKYLGEAIYSRQSIGFELQKKFSIHFPI